MKKIILITGGSRSGKSRYAEQMALSLSNNPVYVATAHVWDDEFRERIKRHQQDRNPQWTNIEEEKELSRHDLTGRVAKSRTVYRRLSVPAHICLAIQGLLPLVICLTCTTFSPFRSPFSVLRFPFPLLLPPVTSCLLALLCWRKLKGYTGDCCGAIFLLTELTAILAISVQLH